MVRRTLREAITETITAKTGENLRERYVAELENYLDKFAGRARRDVRGPRHRGRC